MGPLGWQETIVIFVLALLLFGPKKLPELGKNLAKAIGEFRRASNELKDTWHREMTAIERETEDIKKEAEQLTQATSDYPDSNYDYNYDSSYDYGAYGYGEGGEPAAMEQTPAEAGPEAAAAETGPDAPAPAGDTLPAAGSGPGPDSQPNAPESAPAR